MLGSDFVKCASGFLMLGIAHTTSANSEPPAQNNAPTPFLYNDKDISIIKPTGSIDPEVGINNAMILCPDKIGLYPALMLQGAIVLLYSRDQQTLTQMADYQKEALNDLPFSDQYIPKTGGCLSIKRVA